MKTLLLKAKPIVGKTTYRIPARHPFDVDKDGNLSPAPLTPGIQLAIGKETEVACFDARHEELLRGDTEHLDVVDEDGKHDKPAVTAAPTGVSPELFAKWQKRESEMLEAIDKLDAENQDLAKANAELRNELHEQDEQLSQAAKDKAELEAKLKAAIAALPPPSETKPVEVKPVDPKAETVKAEKPAKK